MYIMHISNQDVSIDVEVIHLIFTEYNNLDKTIYTKIMNLYHIRSKFWLLIRMIRKSQSVHNRSYSLILLRFPGRPPPSVNHIADVCLPKDVDDVHA